MKKSELRQLIKEEISNKLNENHNPNIEKIINLLKKVEPFIDTEYEYFDMEDFWAKIQDYIEELENSKNI